MGKEADGRREVNLRFTTGDGWRLKPQTEDRGRKTGDGAFISAVLRSMSE